MEIEHRKSRMSLRAAPEMLVFLCYSSNCGDKRAGGAAVETVA